MTHDIIVMQTPLGLLHITVTPQCCTSSVGYIINAVNDVFCQFILHVANLFIDDMPMRIMPYEERDNTEVYRDIL